MYVRKCDKCKEEINRMDVLHVRYSFCQEVDLCSKCGEAIIRVLNDNKLLQER